MQVENKKSEGKRGKPLQSSARNLVLNVSNFFKEESEAVALTLPEPGWAQNWLKLSADCLGVSQATIKRIRKDAQDGKPLTTPSKSRRRASAKLNLDDFDLAVIRRCVHSFYESGINSNK